MTRTSKRFLVAGYSVSVLLLAAQLVGIRINTTHSYPPGLYLLTDDPIEKRTLVIFCPPDTPVFQMARERGYIGAGFCPGGYGYMIKKILASSGDRIAISATGVMVNGQLQPKSTPMHADLEGRPLAFQSLNNAVLGHHNVLLMSDYSSKSFDARYFGLVDRSVIISTIRPLWTQ